MIWIAVGFILLALVAAGIYFDPFSCDCECECKDGSCICEE